MKKLLTFLTAIAVLLTIVASLSCFAGSPDGADPLKGRENLALECEVTASNSFENNAYFSAAFITDGIHLPFEIEPHQGWSVDPFSVIPRDKAVDIEVDLLIVYMLDTVVIKPCLYNNGEKMPSSFTVDVSEDGSSYVTVKEVTGLTLEAADDQILTFEPVRGRFVRISITEHSDKVDNTGSYLSEFSELEVYGEKIKPTEAPATHEPTPAPTEAPADAPSEPTEKPSGGKNPGKKGCGGVTGCLPLITLSAAAIVTLIRKRR